jgi:hypothetical protein
VILPDAVHDAWLSGEAGKEILAPFPAEKMKAWAISPRFAAHLKSLEEFPPWQGAEHSKLVLGSHL